MKLGDADFTSHACNDPSEDGDGLGWNLDTDMTTEGKNELIENQKLRELLINFHTIDLRLILADSSGDERIVKIMNKIHDILEDSKK